MTSRLGAAARQLARAVVLVSVLVVALAASAQGQQTLDRLRQQRTELERIRRERDALQERMGQIRSSVHSLSEEVQNINRQADMTAQLVRSLDAQLVSITGEVGSTSAQLVRAQDELVVKRAILRRRLVDIYKRGPLYSTEVLMAAPSFGELIARYKYLHLLTLRDRAMVTRVTQLRDQIVDQRQLLVRLQNDVEQNRMEKQQEADRLRELEQQRGVSLRQAEQEGRQTQAKLTQIQRAEARLTSVIASLEEARRRVESRPNAAAPTASTLRTSDLGRLDWPVDGTILYRFGRVVNPNNTTTRWNGIGIGAAVGTVVHTIAAGEVVVSEQIGTYGLTVIVQHGGGDYSVYGSLSRADVRKGQKVAKGQTVGAVGSSDPDLASHLHFEIRRSKGVAVDPLEWLRGAR
jgi:murein hydrolase activator